MPIGKQYQVRNLERYSKDGYRPDGYRVDIIISVMFWTHQVGGTLQRSPSFCHCSSARYGCNVGSVPVKRATGVRCVRSWMTPAAASDCNTSTWYLGRNTRIGKERRRCPPSGGVSVPLVFFLFSFPAFRDNDTCHMSEHARWEGCHLPASKPFHRQDNTKTLCGQLPGWHRHTCHVIDHQA